MYRKLVNHKTFSFLSQDIRGSYLSYLTYRNKRDKNQISSTEPGSHIIISISECTTGTVIKAYQVPVRPLGDVIISLYALCNKP